MKQPQSKVSLVEKIGYSLGDLAANLVFQTLITYLAFFYTDIYGLKNNDASIIMLSVGLVAAFLFNPIIGAIADRTKSRWGKFRPWILYCYTARRGGTPGFQHTRFFVQGKSDLCCCYLHIFIADVRIEQPALLSAKRCFNR